MSNFHNVANFYTTFCWSIQRCLILLLVPMPILAVPISIQNVNNLESSNNSLVVYERLPLMPPESVCRYKAVSYLTGDEVPTEEPCLRCQCKKQAVVCKLRICTEAMPDAPPPGCVVVQKAKSCCPKLVCPESRKITREQRLSTEIHKNDTFHGFPVSTNGQGFCIHDGTVYAEGSAMKSNSPCDYCFCIRGQMKCSQPQCVIPLNGCKPRYRSFACCPTNYDCSDSNTTAIVQSSAISSPIPPFLKGCRVLNRFVYEGEPVLPIHLEPDKEHLCQSCFCLGGTVRCRPLECARPVDGCEPVTQDGHCCPIRYNCSSSALLEKVEENLLSLESSTSLQTEAHSPSNFPGRFNSTGTIDHFLGNPHDLSNASSPNVTLSENTAPSLSLAILEGSDSEILSNKLRTDIGSREDRQNRDKDRDELLSKSYEDDERDYLFGVPSLEAMDHDLISKMAFDVLSEPSGKPVKTLKSIRPTGSAGEISHSEMSVRSESGESGDVNEIRETISTSSTRPELSPELSSKGPLETLEKGNMTGGEVLDDEIPNSTTSVSNGGEEIHQSVVESEQKSNIFQVLETMTTEMTSPQATIANLHFIPFSVEDALLLPPLPKNESENATFAAPPIKITYDPETVRRSSLIPPLSAANFYQNPLPNPFPEFSNSQLPKGLKDPIQVVDSPQELRDSFRNVIMDVPVSTSLYNNGYYQNGIITNSGQDSKNDSAFPGLVFDASGEHVPGLLEGKTGEGTMAKSSLPLDLETSSKFQNPSRTYSKFVVHDSPSYHQPSKNDEVMTSSSTTRQPSIFSADDDYDPIYEDDDGRARLEISGDLENRQQAAKPETIPASVQFQLAKVNEALKPIRITSNVNQAFPNYDKKAAASIQRVTPDAILKPVVAFPFRITQKPQESLQNHGLKLSGCNIYGKMYRIGDVIFELSGPCVECNCTEIGVQCSERPC